MQSATEKLVLISEDGPVRTVSLNRRERLNALNRALRTELAEAFETLANDPACRCVILTGAGRAFSAGVDLDEFATAPLRADEVGPEGPLVKAMGQFPWPVIAAVNGPAITGGFELALNCDIIVASSAAQFADTHAVAGLSPGWGLSQILPRLVGPGRACLMSFSGRILSGADALEWGLAAQLCAPEELLPFCMELAADIAKADGDALRAIKAGIKDSMQTPLAEGLVREARIGARFLEPSALEAGAAQRAKIRGLKRKAVDGRHLD